MNGLHGTRLGYWAPVVVVATTSCTPTWEAQQLIKPAQLLAAIEAGNPPIILDVRTVEEYESGHIPGAIQIHFQEVPRRIQDLQAFANQDVVVYCERGFRARIAEATLQEAGFDRIYHLEGDIQAWRRAKYPIQKGAS